MCDRTPSVVDPKSEVLVQILALLLTRCAPLCLPFPLSEP